MKMKPWIIAAVVLAVMGAGCSKGAPRENAGEARVAIAVTDSGFTPSSIDVPVGKPVTLVVTRKTDQTCAKEIVFPDQGIHKTLPLNQAVEIRLPPSQKKELTYVCGMNMITGKVVVH